MVGLPHGATGRGRTDDLLGTNQLLCQLSYGSMAPGFPAGLGFYLLSKMARDSSIFSLVSLSMILPTFLYP